MRTGMRSGAIGTDGNFAARVGSFHFVDDFQKRAAGRVLFGRMMNFPRPGAVFVVARDAPRSFRGELKKDIHTDREIRAPDQTGSAILNGGFASLEVFGPAGGANHCVDSERG